MFEGDSADKCAGKISAYVDGGPSWRPDVRRPGSEDPQEFFDKAGHARITEVELYLSICRLFNRKDK